MNIGTTIKISALIPLVLVLTLSKEAQSISACYEVTDFPSVSRIDANDPNLLKVYFNNRHTETINDGIIYTFNNRQWKIGEEVIIDYLQGTDRLNPMNNFPKACKDASKRASRKIKLSIDEFVNFRPDYKAVLIDPEFSLNQTILSCHDTAEYSLLGLGFYDGENSYGYGGIARLQKKSGELEIVRNEYFTNNSINSIIEYNDQIFIGTTGLYECTGLPPTSGLYLYNWDKQDISYVVNNEICGGVIHDMAVWNDELWVATDMGLSKGTAPDSSENAGIMWRYNWKNFIPSKNPAKGLIEVNCKDLYHELLLEMPPSNQHLETSIDFLIKAIEKQYSLQWFFVDFIEKHKHKLKDQD